ncbi:MAG: T9SS type A sorting domain-containing protein, partial [Candidatus Sericytochromatia bacterium]|nr:T9SS type A sorting domain-containing protein [Candidatus Sericytochromatia bacterium]
NGSMHSMAPFPVTNGSQDKLLGIKHDNNTGIYYALIWSQQLSSVSLVSVDITTGSTTTINSFSGFQTVSTSPEYFTYDEINGRYFFRGGLSADMRLYSIDVNSGSIISDPVFPILDDPTDNVLEPQFDNGNGVLYALHWDAHPREKDKCNYVLIMDSEDGMDWLFGWLNVSINGASIGTYNGFNVVPTPTAEYFAIDDSEVLGITFEAYEFVYTGEPYTFQLWKEGVLVYSDGPYPQVDVLYENSCAIQAGINENETSSFSVFPNPAKDKIYIECHEQISEIRIIDFVGRTLEVKREGFEAGMDLSELSPGEYILNVITTSGSLSKRMIISN